MNVDDIEEIVYALPRHDLPLHELLQQANAVLTSGAIDEVSEEDLFNLFSYMVIRIYNHYDGKVPEDMIQKMILYSEKAKHLGNHIIQNGGNPIYYQAKMKEIDEMTQTVLGRLVETPENEKQTQKFVEKYIDKIFEMRDDAPALYPAPFEDHRAQVRKTIRRIKAIDRKLTNMKPEELESIRSISDKAWFYYEFASFYAYSAHFLYEYAAYMHYDMKKRPSEINKFIDTIFCYLLRGGGVLVYSRK